MHLASFTTPGSYRIRLRADGGAATAQRDFTTLVSLDDQALRTNGLQGHGPFEEAGGTTTADRLLSEGETLTRRGRQIPAYEVYVRVWIP